MKKKAALLALLSIAALLPACSTNVQGDDASPVFLEVSVTDSLGVNVATGALVQTGIIIQSRLKIPGAGSTAFLDVRIEDYTVEWRRTDGGTLVPQTERFGATGILSAGGTQTLSDYPIMSGSALGRSPLDRLFPFNGGFDPETGRTEIRTVAIITVHGHTLSGQPVQGAGTMQVVFGYAPLTAKVPSK